MGLIGRMKVDEVSRVPVAVKRFFKLREGDYLEFYPHTDDFPDDAELIAVMIVRSKHAKR